MTQWSGLAARLSKPWAVPVSAPMPSIWRLSRKKIIEPDNLMQAAGIASVDTFRTYISQLSTLQVIEKDSGGYRLAADLAAGL